MTVIEAVTKATKENRKIKRVSWETWHDPKNIYISWVDVLADDWHIKIEDAIYYVGLDTDGNPVSMSTNVPGNSELKWVLLSKFNAQKQKEATK